MGVRAPGSKYGRFLILFLLLLVQACGQPQTSPRNDQILKKTIATLNIEDPVSDVTRNLNAGETRFVGIYAFTCTAPGVEDSDLPLARTHGMNCLNGTSDVIEGIRHERLIRTAREYARQYNIALVEYLRKSSNP